MMDLFLYATVACILVPYWIGVFGGYFTATTFSNANPDTFIHGSLFWLTAILLVKGWRIIRYGS